MWILLLAPVLALLEERPALVARLAFSLETQHPALRLVAALVRRAYLSLRRLHELIHRMPPQRSFDKLALVFWLKGSAALDRSEEWLRAALGAEPRYEDHREELVRAYRRVFPNPIETGRKLGNDMVDWVSLGFQGADPCTDFRGAGALGLEHWLGFCTERPEKAGELAKASGSFAPSQDPLWYSLALVSINLSSYLGHLLLNKPLFIASLVREGSSLKGPLQLFHNQILIGFQNHWQREQQQGLVRSVMDTDASLKRYEQKVPGILWQLVVDN